MLGLLGNLGIMGIILLIILIFLVPFIVTIIVGIGLANFMGFTGVFWWAFVILFYIVVASILGAIGV